MAVYLSIKHSGLPVAEIGKEFGCIKYSVGKKRRLGRSDPNRLKASTSLRSAGDTKQKVSPSNLLLRDKADNEM